MSQPPRDADQPDMTVGDVTALPDTPRIPPVPTISTERRLLVEELARLSFVWAGFLLLALIIIGGIVRAANWDQFREVMEITVPLIGGIIAGGVAYYLSDGNRR